MLGYLVFFLKVLSIISLSLLAILIVIILFCLIIYFIIFLFNIIFGKPWYHINTDVEVSYNNGKTYTNEFINSFYRKNLLLKYEITAKAYGFLSGLRKCKIPFSIEKAPDINVTLHECNGDCTSELKDIFRIQREVNFNIWIKGKKPETTIIILKCYHSNHNISSFKFNLLFKKKYHKQYSRTTMLHF